MIGEGRSADTLHATFCILSLPALIDRFIRGIYSVRFRWVCEYADASLIAV